MSGDIIDALRQAAAAGSGHIVRYLPSTGQEESPAQLLSYTELLEQAEYNAARLYEMPIVGDALRSASSSEAQPVFLVHFEDRLDTMIWFWAVLIAGAVPAITSPSMFSPDRSDRQNHLRHLGNTLKRPLCLTRRSLVAPFEEQDDENAILTFPIDGISAADGSMPHAKRVDSAHEDEDTFPHDEMPSRVAAMMLTSGSTGSAKVVPLTHRQILAALRGKAQVADLRHPKSPFLSWVNMDHVANLVHCHIFAIVSGVSQVQVPAADVLADPLRLLNLLSRHRVSRAFAPNFILARLRRLLDAGQTAGLDADLNLAALYLDTGGEANVVEVCVGLQALLREHGAPEDVIVPSFGMTETCAGCIFNSHCPSYDQSKNLDFASLGTCMPGLRMRVSKIGGDSNDVKPGERGSLELAGEAVFAGYFNNPAATADAFTDDGWFRTGDLAFLDEQDKLHLDGRLTDVININGVKYLPFELESALERADIPGATSTYFCCFSTREVGADTESVHVLYLPSFEESDDAARYQTQEHIMRVTSMHIRCHVQVLPLRAQDLPKSTLGKLSRTKLKDDLQRGHFAAQHNVNQTGIDRHRQTLATDPTSDDEAAVLAIIRQQLRVPDELDFTVHDSILSKGATSMDLVAIMHDINKKLQLLRPLMLIDLLRDPTARGVAARTRQDISAREYDPIVNLQPHGNQTPLWLVHPGVGEVLVFVTLAHRITDRPVHAFRIRGFNAGETTFGSLLEMWQTYHDAIKQRQPRGPYAIAGYSFGGMVAFEVAKLLEAGGDEVRFCGSWNLPPHIKTRMRELIWEECLIHLFYFVGLMEEATAYTHKPVISAFEREGRRLEAIQYLRPYCDSTRWDELGLSEGYYLHWVEIASSTQAMAIDYEPTGTVRCMDVFVADPLSHVAKDREHWRTTRLAAWKSFVREDVRFHDVQGAHFTMLNSEHVPSFAETLRKALRARGV